tara:strand:+ start:596 stop:922 length:327 start_codon:yes stop_codon:yes gene_type:complete
MNNFETTILISPDISKNNLDTINSNFEKLISDEGGTIIGKEDWGLRNLAYKINTLKKAFYFYFQINIDSQKIEILKKNISQNEDIIRYLFIKVESHDELPSKIIKGDE